MWCLCGGYSSLSCITLTPQEQGWNPKMARARAPTRDAPSQLSPTLTDRGRVRAICQTISPENKLEKGEDTINAHHSNNNHLIKRSCSNKKHSREMIEQWTRSTGAWLLSTQGKEFGSLPFVNFSCMVISAKLWEV